MAKTQSFRLKDLLTIDLLPPTSYVRGAATGSITPKTHEGRGFFDFSSRPPPLVATNSPDSATKDAFFVDRFKHDEGKTEYEVSRYGIDSSKITLTPMMAPTFDKNKVKMAEGIGHYDVEKLVFKEAVMHLLSTQDAKTVLVHILERDPNGVVDIGAITTHTVLLYKNYANASGAQILVIDPNNFEFSRHLANQEMTDFIAGCVGKPVELVASTKDSQIYQPDKKNIGSGPLNYRDCTDIAVKLAFGLSSVLQLTIDGVLESPIVKALSNDQGVNDSFPQGYWGKAFIKVPFRAQHKSNIEVGLKLYECSKATKNTILKLDDTCKKKSLKDTHAKIITDDVGHQATLTALIALTEESFTEMQNELNTSLTGLSLLDVPDFN